METASAYSPVFFWREFTSAEPSCSYGWDCERQTDVESHARRLNVSLPPGSHNFVATHLLIPLKQSALDRAVFPAGSNSLCPRDLIYPGVREGDGMGYIGCEEWTVEKSVLVGC